MNLTKKGVVKQLTNEHRAVRKKVGIGIFLVLLLSFPFIFAHRMPPKAPAVPVPKQKESYLDIAVNDLNPKYDNKRVCLYGDFSAGEEHVGFGISVWVNPASNLADYLISQLPETKDIGCGIIKYFPKGTGQMGFYNYQLLAEIITESKDESPYTEKVNASKDCSKIPGINRRDICYWDFAAREKNVKICEFISESKIKSSCFLHLGYNLTQSNICQKIPLDNKTGVDWRLFLNIWLPNGIPVRELCYAISSSEIKDCDNVSDQNLKEQCLANVALQTENADVCSNIKFSTTKRFCYADIAIKLNDLSICEKLPEGQVMHPNGSGEYISEQSECYWAYVARTKNYKICDRIKEEGSRISCQSIK